MFFVKEEKGISVIDIPKSFSQFQIGLVRQMEQEVGEKCVDPDKAAMVRQQLNLMLGHAKSREVKLALTTAIWFIKQLAKLPLSRTHPLTDHAFLRYLQREEGLDVDALKDQALRQIYAKGLADNLVELRGAYVTYLPNTPT